MLNIGKAGLEAVVEEARAQLRKRREVKFRINQPLIEGRMKEQAGRMAEELARLTGAEVVDVRGRTFTLRRVEK